MKKERPTVTLYFRERERVAENGTPLYSEYYDGFFSHSPTCLTDGWESKSRAWKNSSPHRPAAEQGHLDDHHQLDLDRALYAKGKRWVENQDALAEKFRGRR